MDTRSLLTLWLSHPQLSQWPAEWRALLCVSAAKLRQADGRPELAGRWLKRARSLTRHPLTLREIQQLEASY